MGVVLGGKASSGMEKPLPRGILNIGISKGATGYYWGKSPLSAPLNATVESMLRTTAPAFTYACVKVVGEQLSSWPGFCWCDR